jgi:hypothetical protein
MKYINNEQHPYGENAIVAIMCYNGYNVEDSILFNEGSLKRGLFRTTYYNMYETREEEERTIFRIARVKLRICSGGAAAQTHTDIAAVRDRLEELRLQALASEQLDQHLGGARLVPWWIHALGANQLHQIVARLGADALQ